ncbi:MAG: glycoside hydrolase family 127 protein [Armatimonadetes bacterium]|nr:glycoside hydrolase family 127 protein [Armatimonadota bacterium]
MNQVDTLHTLPHATAHFTGYLGQRIADCIGNRVMAQALEPILEPFRTRTESNAGHWRCEYWGKWLTSAVLAYQLAPSSEHRAVLDRGVVGLLETQSTDGYIGTYTETAHLGIWDVWGRKYTLLGLLAYHDLTGDKAALTAAQRVADHLMGEAPIGRINLGDTGIDVLKGLAPTSILEAFVQLYRATSDAKYLEFAQSIVAGWSVPTAFNPAGMRLLEDALAGVPPEQINSPKAYEMMSCFEGVCELYRETGAARLREALLAFAESILVHERMAHGGAGNHELWCEGVRGQTEVLEQPGETCVTVTWMKLCLHLLRLTGDPKWADELELSLYNALLGAMTPDGRWWAYNAPLIGQRVASHCQHADVGLSCCVANGPRGLLLTPQWALMGTQDGIVVNLYAPGIFTVGEGFTLEISGDYPRTDTVTLTLRLEAPRPLTLSLRIPAWSQKTHLCAAGEHVSCEPGAYAQIERLWQPGDTVTLTLDLRGQVLSAPRGAPSVAVRRGPILLALDDRLVPDETLAARLEPDSEGFVTLTPHEAPEGFWMVFDAPFAVRPSHFFHHHTRQIPLCDYASAGTSWEITNSFRTWIPQPVVLSDLCPPETWKLMYPDKERPEIP